MLAKNNQYTLLLQSLLFKAHKNDILRHKTLSHFKNINNFRPSNFEFAKINLREKFENDPS